MITDLENFSALDPFFRIIERGLDGLVDGRHFFELLDENVIVEYVITVPDYPRRVVAAKPWPSSIATMGPPASSWTMPTSWPSTETAKRQS